MEDLKKNIALVAEEIESMSDDEFQFQLSEHIDGDIANALLETGAIEQSSTWEMPDWIDGDDEFYIQISIETKDVLGGKLDEYLTEAWGLIIEQNFNETLIDWNLDTSLISSNIISAEQAQNDCVFLGSIDSNFNIESEFNSNLQADDYLYNLAA